MENSSLDYRKKLYSQIQEEYGKLVYTYTCHFKMADRLSTVSYTHLTLPTIYSV